MWRSRRIGRGQVFAIPVLASGELSRLSHSGQRCLGTGLPTPTSQKRDVGHPHVENRATEDVGHPPTVNPSPFDPTASSLTPTIPLTSVLNNSVSPITDLIASNYASYNLCTGESVGFEPPSVPPVGPPPSGPAGDMGVMPGEGVVNVGSPRNDLALSTMANCLRQNPLAALFPAFNDISPSDAYPISFPWF